MTAATEHTPPPAAERTKWAAVVAVSLGIVLVALDMTVVAVVLPTLGADLHASPTTTQWVILAYSLPLAALSIPAGRWLDRAGPLPAFLLAIGGFGASSVLIAMAPTVPLVLAGRAAQGLFGALIGAVGMPIISSAVRPEHRARAMSIVLTLIPLAGVAGPAVGGMLTEAFGWRSVFLLNIPVVLAAGWFGRKAIPARLGDRAGLPVPGWRPAREALVLGVATASVFLALDASTGVRGNGLVLPVSLAIVAVLAAAAWARLREARPVLELVRRRELALPLIALPMITAGVGALNFLVPYFLTEVGGAAPTVIGFALLALAAGMAAFSPIAGVLADRIGNQPVALAGVVVILAGLVALLLVDGAASAWDVAWRLAIVGVGNGLFAGPNSAAVLAATPPELAGTSGGVTSLLRTLGFALGPALGALTWTMTGGDRPGFVAGVTVLIAAAAVALGATFVAYTRARAGGAA